jgi:hypothetical protein
VLPPQSEARIMLDVFFIVIGTLLIAAMAVYADACRRL